MDVDDTRHFEDANNYQFQDHELFQGDVRQAVGSISACRVVLIYICGLVWPFGSLIMMIFGVLCVSEDLFCGSGGFAAGYVMIFFALLWCSLASFFCHKFIQKKSRVTFLYGTRNEAALRSETQRFIHRDGIERRMGDGENLTNDQIASIAKTQVTEVHVARKSSVVDLPLPQRGSSAENQAVLKELARFGQGGDGYDKAEGDDDRGDRRSRRDSSRGGDRRSSRRRSKSRERPREGGDGSEMTVRHSRGKSSDRRDDRGRDRDGDRDRDRDTSF
eukprot:GFYU01030658.1.p1 GENE.GFYU01030658.1~~GFYU01030658.1.p1  ORF type:complete len:275 (-),score=38.80 GFYU01030658.1:6-830(-)